MGDGVEGGDRPAYAQNLDDPTQAIGHKRAVGLDVGLHVRERAPVAREAQAGAQGLHAVQRGQELARGVGRVAEVEVGRNAAQQVVPGDQQPALGLEQAHEGAWPGVSITVQRPRSVSTSTPATRSRAGSTKREKPEPDSRRACA